jgi:stage V sporulation protein SpoVS
VSAKPSLAEQLTAARTEVIDLSLKLDASRSAGALAERLAVERKAEIADLRDYVYAQAIEIAEMRGYLAKIADDAAPPIVVQEQPKPMRFGQSIRGRFADTAYDAGAAYSTSRPAPAPWYRR